MPYKNKEDLYEAQKRYRIRKRVEKERETKMLIGQVESLQLKKEELKQKLLDERASKLLIFGTTHDSLLKNKTSVNYGNQTDEQIKKSK